MFTLENTIMREKRKRMQLDKFLWNFVNGQLGKKMRHDNYSVRKEDNTEKIVYTAYQRVYSHEKGGTRKIMEGEEELAVRLKCGAVLSNADRLGFCGSYMAFGHRHMPARRQIAPAQRMLEEAGAIPVPFTVFKEAGLNVVGARIIEKAPGETVIARVGLYNDKTGESVEIDEPRHYVGACLLEVNGECFLFDIDREELKNKHLNPFMVKLKQPASSIQEAYIRLKPEKITLAEQEGRKVIRVGEWFLIKRHNTLPELPNPPKELEDCVKSPPHAKQMGAAKIEEFYEPGKKYGYKFADKELERKYEEEVRKWEAARQKLLGYAPNKGKLQAGTNRPHYVEKHVSCEGMLLVSGKITHTGNEHRELDLEGWWEPVVNTAAESWRITGEID